MLHLHLPGKGRCQQGETVDAESPVVINVATKVSPPGGCYACCWETGAAMVRTLASCRSTTKFLAHSTTVGLTFVTSSQTLRLRCFQSVIANRWFCLADNVNNLCYKISILYLFLWVSFQWNMNFNVCMMKIWVYLWVW